MNTFALLQNINTPEIILIFLIVLLLFGAKRLPELFRSFGKSIREFKKATSEIEDDIRTAMDEEPKKQPSHPKPVDALPEDDPAKKATLREEPEVIEKTKEP